MLQCPCQALFVTVTLRPERDEEDRDHVVFAEAAIQTTWRHQDVWDALETIVRMDNKHATSCCFKTWSFLSSMISLTGGHSSQMLKLTYS